MLFRSTRNLLWQEGAYNKHIGTKNVNMWTIYTTVHKLAVQVELELNTMYNKIKYKLLAEH